MARPNYVQQFYPNNCWAACLEMWMQGEAGYAWTQDQIVNSVDAFVVGPQGINVDALGRTIDRLLGNLTLSMEWRKVENFDKKPYIETILEEVGSVYIAYRRQNGGGHANVIYGYTTSGYAVLDPDPKVGPVVKSWKEFFSIYPCFVGWRHTPAMIGYGYTGRPSWDYAP